MVEVVNKLTHNRGTRIGNGSTPTQWKTTSLQVLSQEVSRVHVQQRIKVQELTAVHTIKIIRTGARTGNGRTEVKRTKDEEKMKGIDMMMTIEATLFGGILIIGMTFRTEGGAEAVDAMKNWRQGGTARVTGTSL
jgi:hypothetical protein